MAKFWNIEEGLILVPTTKTLTEAGSFQVVSSNTENSNTVLNVPVVSCSGMDTQLLTASVQQGIINKTFYSNIEFANSTKFSAASNQINFQTGSGKYAKLNVVVPATDVIYTIDDMGANASFVMTQAAQTIAGAKTFSNTPIFNNNLQLGIGQDALTIVGSSSNASRSYTVPDVGISSSFIMSTGDQSIQGIKKFYSDTKMHGINLLDSGATNGVTILAPATVATPYTIHLPTRDASSGQTFVSDGSGNLSFANFSTSALGNSVGALDTIPQGNSYVTIATVDINTNGSRPIKVELVPDGGASGCSFQLTIVSSGIHNDIQLLEDAVQVGHIDYYGASQLPPAIISFVVPSPAIGSKTYKLQVKPRGGLCAVQFCKLLAYEI